jgi:hypothetical protein
MALQLSEGLLQEALATLRRCGAGRNECVCWLTGPLQRPGLADTVLHPRHSSSPGGYRIDDAWLTETWIALARTAREVRAQIHTHPGSAYHSATDDAFPAVQTVGFVSIVVPDFAQAEPDVGTFYVAELGPDGGWRTNPPTERLLSA